MSFTEAEVDEFAVGDDPTERPAYMPEPDPVTQAVGARWYAARYMVDECRERYTGSVLQGHPERFDRFYPHSDIGPLLIDILVGDGDQQQAQAIRKHVAFKRSWCEQHDRRYLVLSEDEAANPAAVRALLTELSPGPEAQPKPNRKRTAAPKRGEIQRPKAAA